MRQKETDERGKRARGTMQEAIGILSSADPKNGATESGNADHGAAAVTARTLLLERTDVAVGASDSEWKELP